MKIQRGTMVVVMLILGLLLPMACSPKAAEKSGMGNTNANIVNMGFSVTDGDWIYFLHQQGEGSLYKMKKDGTEESEIIPEPVMFLNVVDGFIYFVSPKEDTKIFRIRPDGTERTLVVDTPSSYLISDGRLLYYIDGTMTGEKPARKLYKSKLDGTERTLISEMAAAQFNLVGDVIYYVGAEDRLLHRVKTDGTGDQVLGDVKPGTINVQGDKIYYVNDPEGTKQIWSMNTDGTGAIRLSEDPVTTLNVSGDWIYYGHPKDEMLSFEFKKMKLDGTEPSLVNDDQPMILNIHDDLLAYLQMDLATFSVKETFVRTDGTQRKEFSITPAGGETDTGYEIYQMGEMAQTGDFFVDVKSVYSSNLRLAMDPTNDDPNLDEIGNKTFLFITFEVTSDSPDPLELYGRVGLIDSDDHAETYLWTPLTDLTDRPDIVKDSPYLDQSQYQESLVISTPGETRTIQASGVLELVRTGGVLFAIFDVNQHPLAAINVPSRPELFVTPEDARDRVEMLSPEQTNMVPMPLIRFSQDGESQVFYPFEYQEPGKEKAYLLVDRVEGAVYRGELKDGKIIPTEPVK